MPKRSLVDEHLRALERKLLTALNAQVASVAAPFEDMIRAVFHSPQCLFAKARYCDQS